ncbi:hypothetical protein GQS52_13645 [Streptomyces sp. SCUT-3]|uniref:hypothetical protein n=1 Tax=Streptomyces sp. SCUT-3 TaxID=2684469 RepID=UPI0015FA6FAD|nr:hypothetical protein [Streptomyces sp. SCUT-3]QMV22647.1 hypothetical protein GQS52_13645 [Streptomyces sp. SCUT-3]
MARVFWSVALLLVCAAAATVAWALLRSAYRHWTLERGGAVYELPVGYRDVVLRLAGAGAAGVLAASSLWVSQSVREDRAGTTVQAAAAPSRPTPLTGSAAGGAGDADGGNGADTKAHRGPGAKPGADRTEKTGKKKADEKKADKKKAAGAKAAAAPAAKREVDLGGRPRTVGRPSNGRLQEFPDGTRVWLPRQYDYPSAKRRAFPVVVTRTAERDQQDVFRAFAAHTERELADPFVLVLPAPAADCAADPAPLLEAVARHYRLVGGAKARGVLGTGVHAACAVRQELEHPDRYAAAAGLWGDYADVGAPPGAAGTPAASGKPDEAGKPGTVAKGDGRPQVLLGAVAGDGRTRTSALRLRGLVRPGAEARVLDTPVGRHRLLAATAGYFTEKLTGPQPS